ncbi:MAG: TlpA family protein disulfide reductase [Planctomycetaceae bacterium]|nr:TlpA family protein disulfide reductase [Planctomycetaceae bacterium]
MANLNGWKTGMDLNLSGMRTRGKAKRLMVGAVALLCTMGLGCTDHETPESHGANDRRPTTQATQDHDDQTREILARVDAAGLEAMIKQADREDRYLVLDFWATWCLPCVEMFPALHEGVSGLGPRVRLASVTLDAPGELEAKAVGFLADHHALDDAYLLVPDQDGRQEVVQRLGRRWRDLAVPAILVYSPEGELVEEFLSGAEGAEPILTRLKQMVGSTDSAVQQPRENDQSNGW